MNLGASLFCSTIGRKFLMAITGVVLIGFIIGHLVGNLQIFGHPDSINGYAHFLQSLGPTLWLARIVLLVAVAIHIWAAVVLTIESKRARGQSYKVNTWIQATLSSRYMRWTGVVIFAFIAYHLAHFTLGGVQTSTFKTALPEYVMTSDYHVFGLTVVKAGALVHNVHDMVVLGFQNVIVAFFYIIAVGLLSLHIAHGADSIFQTVGWRSSNWGGALRKIVLLLTLVYFLLNAAIPASILAGQVRLASSPVEVTSQH